MSSRQALPHNTAQLLPSCWGRTSLKPTHTHRWYVTCSPRQEGCTTFSITRNGRKLQNQQTPYSPCTVLLQDAEAAFVPLLAWLPQHGARKEAASQAVWCNQCYLRQDSCLQNFLTSNTVVSSEHKMVVLACVHVPESWEVNSWTACSDKVLLLPSLPT